jgi:hypothetical protein
MSFTALTVASCFFWRHTLTKWVVRWRFHELSSRFGSLGQFWGSIGACFVGVSPFQSSHVPLFALHLVAREGIFCTGEENVPPSFGCLHTVLSALLVQRTPCLVAHMSMLWYSSIGVVRLPNNIY